MSNDDNRSVSLTAEQLAQIVREARAPYVDPVRERQAKEQRANALREELAAAEMRKRRQAACNHMRNNGRDGKSAIQWQLHSGGVWNGVCPRCGRVAKQDDPDFQALMRLPNDNVPAIAGIL